MNGKVLGCACLLSASVVVPAQAAPKELYGKTIRLSWSENRVQRAVGQDAWNNRTNAVQMTYYVSTAGPVFVRADRTANMGRRRAGSSIESGSLERGPGERAPGVPAGGIRFQGATMTAIAGYRSGARQVVVEFGAGFSNCSARVVLGKEGGRNLRQRSLITKQEIEVQSVEVSSATCSVSAGNPFEG